MGLLEALKQYASDAVGGSLNTEVGNTLSGLLNYGKDRARYIGGLLDDSSPINKDFKNWHDRTQLGLADLIAGREGPQADYGYSQIMNMAGVAPLGITAWHGSPHKFDKFSLDKIGTGEGAQAYGHGLYLAESPDVAKDYAGALSAARANKPIGNVDLQQVYQNLPNDVPDTLLAARRDFRALNESGELSATDRRDFLEAVKGNITASKRGNLYKTDIPNEAVARFLDWDKKLSEQAPEVQRALAPFMQQAKAKFPNLGNDPEGRVLYTMIGGHVGNDAQRASTSALNAAGIPGIKYLDGGSRPTGQVDKQLLSMLDKHGGDPVAAVDDFMRFIHNTPKKKEAMREQFLKQLQQTRTSNFVAFDPEMIRILERNGQPTGLEPWKPGEYRLGDLLK